MFESSKPSFFFVTGTDTEIGKTHVTVSLLRAFQTLGLSTLGLKPLSAGLEETPAGFANEDARQLQAASSLKWPLDRINPIALKDPISPHIAAKREKKRINVANLMTCIRPALTAAVDVILCEGAGGWHTPINDNETLADFVKALGCPVIAVTGLRLGCLNHTLLTWQAIQQTNIPIAAWCANMVQPNMPALAENIQTLINHSPSLHYAITPHQPPHHAETQAALMPLVKSLSSVLKLDKPEPKSSFS